MGNERQPTAVLDRIDDSLRFVGERSQLASCAECQQVVLLRVAVLVVQLLPDQHQHPSVQFLVIALETLHQDVVIGDDDGIQSGLNGSAHDVLVRATAVRVAGVHVQIDDDFVHRSLVDDFPSVQV